ncbi:MAG: TIGR01210 family radical SAM protein [Thermoplasmata archaeon]|nr:MAG: TIGR01210 family radical SAM protein [Thermoplasmata archaeon]
MKELEQFCRELKKNFKPRDKGNHVKTWSEKDYLEGIGVVDAFVIILRTRGCSWAIKSGCSMCGYFNDSTWRKLSANDILSQFNLAMKNYNGEQIVKIFTSGSFLDENEVPKITLEKILLNLANKTRKISIETRPEYVTEERLKEIRKLVDKSDLEISIGLESANDKILEYSINKGFKFEDYRKAAKIIIENDLKLKTYLLVKPPFLTEREAINDCIDSAKKIMDFPGTISLNPVCIQKNTLVEYLWKNKEYRPPWLWSITEILKTLGKNKKNNIRVKCDIVAGGRERGAHNCGKCDHLVLDKIRSFSLHQNIEELKDVYCECKEEWKEYLDLQELTHTEPRLFM